MGLLSGRRILVLEDQYLIAISVAELIESHGGTVVGPVGRLQDAFALTEDLDGAILDVNLNGSDSFELADRLIAEGIPVIFHTGRAPSEMPERFARLPRLEKPLSASAGERVLRRVFGL